ncbi:MAG: carbohydrate binding domain-containing protein [Phycisphaerae bacterium]|nr:carbohydrate binding domain-containing protein [Phycisphaerae bacterium]
MRTAFLAFIVALASHAGSSLMAEQGAFPFAMPALDASKTSVDVSALNGGPLGDKDRISVKDGHFVRADGQRVRMVGVNLSFGANFPTHEDAEAVAAHLAKFGVNVVRHHHMDSSDIWKWHKDGTREVDEAKLERLAYFVTRLGKHGIYSDINTHVSRTFTEKEGFPQADKLVRYNKYTLYFVPRMRELYKEYARRLLTYKNPHTGRRLVDEPSVAMVEITNENRFSPAGLSPLRDVPEAYHKPLQQRWNAFLKDRYGTTDALRKAWGQSSEPLGENIADFGDFSKGLAPWSLMDHGVSKAEAKVHRSGPENTSALQIQVDKVGPELFQLEFARHGLSLEADRLYTLSFWVKSSEPREVWVDVSRAGPPWNPLGFGRTIEVDRQWRRHQYVFRADETIKDKARYIFKIGGNKADLWLAEPRIRAGGDLLRVAKGASLEAGTIALPIDAPSAVCRNDVTDFMVQVETEFFKDTGRFLEDDLKVRCPIAGTQIGYVDLRALAVLDYVDAHTYWQHPRWAGQAWRAVGWTIGNTPTVLNPSGGSLPGLSNSRVLGLPYTVSEYNQPAPNEYQAEFMPSFAILGSLQDWDAIFIYSFQHGSDNWRARKIQSFFDVNGNPLVMGLLPAAAMMYRRGDVAPCREFITLRLGDHAPSWQAWVHRIGIDLKAGPRDRPNRSHARAPEPTVSDTGQVTWDNRHAETARFLLNTPRSKAAVGFTASSTIQLGEVTIETGPTRNGFGVITVTSLDGKPIEESKHVLVTTIAHAANTGMVWNEKRTSVENRWGISPPLVEIQPATIKVRCGATTAYALDAAGARAKKATVSREGPVLRVGLDPADHAIWYELCSEN